MMRYATHFLSASGKRTWCDKEIAGANLGLLTTEDPRKVSCKTCLKAMP